MATAYTNLVFPSIPDNSVSTNKIQNEAVTTDKIKNLSVTNDKIANATIAKNKLTAVGQQISAEGTLSAPGNLNFTDVPNLSITITTTGRPVLLSLKAGGDDPTKDAYLGSAVDRYTTATLLGRYLRNGTSLGTFEKTIKLDGELNHYGWFFYFDACLQLDVPTAGTYVYKLQLSFKEVPENPTVDLFGSVGARLKLQAFEL